MATKSQKQEFMENQVMAFIKDQSSKCLCLLNGLCLCYKEGVIPSTNEMVSAGIPAATKENPYINAGVPCKDDKGWSPSIKARLEQELTQAKQDLTQATNPREKDIIQDRILNLEARIVRGCNFSGTSA